MLSTMRSTWLLFALFALVAFSHAFMVENLNMDGINAYLHHGMKRQADGTGVSSSAQPAPTSSDEPEPPSTSADEPESTPAPEPSSTSARPPPSTSSAAPAPTSDDPEPTSAAPAPSSQASRSPSSAAPAPSTTDAPAPSSEAAAPSSSSSRRTTPLVTQRPIISTEIAPTTTVITITSDGRAIESTSVGSAIIEHTTGMATETLPADPENSSGGGGMSSSTKSIIGGVVGGVGGAILLGGIAIVCWRMWGRKKRISEDDADLMAGTGAALGDKSHNNTSPFQSNLEQYHNPGGRPNAAANF